MSTRIKTAFANAKALALAPYVVRVEVTEEVVTGREHHLVEALGTRIMDALFERFGIDWVTIHVRKPNPLSGTLDYTGVRMTRKREP